MYMPVQPFESVHGCVGQEEPSVVCNHCNQHKEPDMERGETWLGCRSQLVPVASHCRLAVDDQSREGGVHACRPASCLPAQWRAHACSAMSGRAWRMRAGQRAACRGPCMQHSVTAVWYRRAGQAAQVCTRQVLTNPVEARVWDCNGPEVVWGMLVQRWPCTEA